MRYAIVRGYDLNNLVEQVNEFMSAQPMETTWVPHGQPFTSHGSGGVYWHQVIWRVK